MFDTVFNTAIEECTKDSLRNDFSPEKNFTSWRLSEMTNKHRGEVAEIAVCKILMRLDYTGIHHIGGSHPFDIDTDQGRIEVKSAMVQKGQARFNFKGVKPENFDDLVLVFVHPEYIEIRHLTSRRASDMVNNSGCLNVKSPFIKGLGGIPNATE